MIQIFGTSKCKGTRAAQRFFKDRSLPVQNIDLAEKGMSRGELASVARAVGGVRALYDAAGIRVRERGLQHAAPSDERIAELLVEDPQLLVTPVVRDGARAAVGVAEAFWKELAAAAKAAPIAPKGAKR